jgi:altronate hydrolase
VLLRRDLLAKYELTDKAIVNHHQDQVAVAKTDIAKGTILLYQARAINVQNLICRGQRFALMDIAKGEYIKQFGFAFARSRGIMVGALVSHLNIQNQVPKVELAKFRRPKPTGFSPKYLDRNFMGFKRGDGNVGTRNYYVVIPTSMCASETALQVALSMDNKTELNKYPNVDGIVAIPHAEGCGCDSGLPIDRLMTVLKGYICHPNVGGCLMMDLGCEQTNYEKMHAFLADIVKTGLKPIDWITIQDHGTRLTVDKAKAIIRRQLAKVNLIEREPAPIAELVVGTECGASDSFSGITANPIIGRAADKVVAGGGAVILSEVTEMVGTFGMLLNRFRNLEIANKFKAALGWYEGIAQKLGLTLAPNLVPKNIEGGLINNYIKSLGAVMKGGTTAIEDVIDYAEPITKKGLSIMQGPGNDPESVTGIVASGANIICFSTGKGTTTGEAICPVIKIASNEETFKKLPEDMDFDASRLLRNAQTVEAMGEELLKKIIAVASGQKTWSEKWKQRQFQIWTAGKLSL